MHNIVQLSPLSNFRIFSLPPKGNPYHPISPFLYPLAPTNLLSASVDLPTWTFYIYKWNHPIRRNLCLHFLAQSFQGSSMLSIDEYFIPFNWGIISHCLFISWWIFGYFSLFGCYEYCCYELLCIVFWAWAYVFILLGIYLGVELLGYLVTLCLTFWITTKMFFILTVPFYIPTSNVCEFQFLYILANPYF